jgi:surfeit locus 1 family protein
MLIAHESSNLKEGFCLASVGLSLTIISPKEAAGYTTSMWRILTTPTSIICLALAVCMMRASAWQWDRHLQKKELIATLEDTLKQDPIDLLQLAKPDTNWSKEIWRRVHIAGTYDFQHEVIVRRNRGSQDHAGFHVLTPLRLDGPSEIYVLVDRGFIPLGREAREFRSRYHSPSRIDQFALVKDSARRTLFAPADPAVGAGKSWADIWIRVNISAMQQQLPFQVLPIYVELMSSPDDPLLPSKIVKENSAAKNEVLSLTGQKYVENLSLNSPDANYPTPLFDTTPPPDIHLGYVYEWAFMAALTLAIGAIAQRKTWRALRQHGKLRRM